MNVLHLADFPLSLAPLRLVQVQQLGGLNARLISHSDTYGGPRYPFDLLASENAEVLRELFERADLIHFHNSWRESLVLAALPWAADLVRHKPAVVQFHSPRLDIFEETLGEKSLPKLVVAQYQARLYPECRPVPNAIPIDDPLHRPLSRRNSPPIVAFLPSGCRRSGWWDKGCSETLRVLESGFQYRFATGVPWEKSMRLKQACDIAIDEIKTGSYHLSSLESLSQGLATIAGIDDQTVDMLEAVTGTRIHPWIVARPENLSARLTALIQDPACLEAHRRESRAYMERFWNTEVLTRFYTNIYLETQTRFAP